MDSNTPRRMFLTGLAAPLILGATNKSGSKKPILGEGEHTYEVTHDWGELPADIQYGNTHGVCEDSHGHIYIHHTVYSTSEKPDSMVVFDHKGKFVKSWGKEFKGGAHGLHIRKEGKQEFLYLCDTKRGLMVKTTLNGEEVFTLGYPKESEPYSKADQVQPHESGNRARTAISILATATARATSTNTTAKANISAPLAARARKPVNYFARTESLWIRAAPSRC